MIAAFSFEIILTWSRDLLALCAILSIYEMGVLLGTKILGGHLLACECGFVSVFVEPTIKGVRCKIRLLPITIGFTIAIHDSFTNRAIIRKPLIVQLRRRYGIDLGTLGSATTSSEKPHPELSALYLGISPMRIA